MMSKEDRQRRIDMWRDVEERVRFFFADRCFTEVRTPILVGTPGMEPNLSPFETDLRLVNPSKRVRAGLITSPEYSMKKILGSGIRNIYTITPVFRNDESAGGWHLPEFTMLEWYGVGGYDELMNETEQLLNFVLEEEAIWPRIAHKDANVDALGVPHVEAKQFFLTEYPAQEGSLARLSTDGYAERFEAYSDGLELCNGFCELTDSVEQRERFQQEALERKRLNKTVFPVDEMLLKSLEGIKGSVYGNALGLDRLVMLKYRIADINDIQVVPFEERYLS